MKSVTPDLAQPSRKLTKKEKAQYLRKAKLLLQKGHDLSVWLEVDPVADDYSIGPTTLTIKATLGARLPKARKGVTARLIPTDTQRISFKDWVAQLKAVLDQIPG